VQPPQTYTMAQ